MPRLKQIEAMLLKDPEDAFLLFALAKEYESQDLQEKAVTTYEQLRQIDPNYVGLYYHLAHLYAEQALKETALSIYNQGMTVAQKIGDRHAYSELQNARMNLEIE